MFERIDALIGIENRNKLENTKVTLVGLGGVGGFTLEALVRTGIGHIKVIDKDSFEESNLNRQILCSRENLGMPKVDAAVKRARTINPKIEIDAYNVRLDESNIDILRDSDYVIDAIDDIDAKVIIIKYCKENNIKLYVSLGTANRISSKNVFVTTLDKTKNDALARVLRHNLRRENISLDKINVVYSEDIPLKKEGLSSVIFAPSRTGLLLAETVIEDIINKTSQI